MTRNKVSRWLFGFGYLLAVGGMIVIAHSIRDGLFDEALIGIGCVAVAVLVCLKNWSFLRTNR